MKAGHKTVRSEARHHADSIGKKVQVLGSGPNGMFQGDQMAACVRPCESCVYVACKKDVTAFTEERTVADDGVSCGSRVFPSMHG